MAVVLCTNCGKPKMVAPWNSTRVVKVAFCAKCKPQPFTYTGSMFGAKGRKKGFVSAISIRARRRSSAT